MLIVKYLLYAKIRFWILPVVLLIFGLFYTFGIMGIMGIPANDGAIAAFPILLGLGIDYAVQFHMRFDNEAGNDDRSFALTETLTKTGPAVLIALGATSLGSWRCSSLLSHDPRPLPKFRLSESSAVISPPFSVSGRLPICSVMNPNHPVRAFQTAL